MSTPFFTILIPTKNRPECIKRAVTSVLSQSFANYHVVVVDNSDNELATATAAQLRPIVDGRVRYVRASGQLSMPDNWEYASSFVEGEFATVLSDRNVYRPRSLELIADTAMRTGSPAVVWGCDLFGRDSSGLQYIRGQFSGRVYRHRSAGVIEAFCRNDAIYHHHMPRLLNCCVHRETLKAIRSVTGGRICLPVSPDYTFGFLLLSVVDNIVQLDVPLYINCGSGNGLSFRSGGAVGKRFMQDLQMTPEELFATAPCKALVSYNLMVRDFNVVRRLVAPRLGYIKIDMVEYYNQCFGEVLHRKWCGAPWKPDAIELYVSLQKEPDAVRSAVTGSPMYRDLMKWSPHRAKGYLRRWLNRTSFYRNLRTRLRRRTVINPDVFSVASGDVFEAIAVDESLHRSFREAPPDAMDTFTVGKLLWPPLTEPVEDSHSSSV
jgi:glycosyltransferase involved in cell wall biosynthesis